MSYGSDMNEEQLAELIKRYKDSELSPKYIGTPKTDHDFNSIARYGEVKKSGGCLHDSCSECGGTGIRRDGGMCIHGISCPCSKCSSR